MRASSTPATRPARDIPALPPHSLSTQNEPPTTNALAASMLRAAASASRRMAVATAMISAIPPPGRRPARGVAGALRELGSPPRSLALRERQRGRRGRTVPPQRARCSGYARSFADRGNSAGVGIGCTCSRQRAEACPCRHDPALNRGRLECLSNRLQHAHQQEVTGQLTALRLQAQLGLACEGYSPLKSEPPVNLTGSSVIGSELRWRWFIVHGTRVGALR